MDQSERFKNVMTWFRTNVAVAETELEYENPYQLIVAVILSAQCTDKRVNIVTKEFFKKYPDAPSLSKTEVSDIFELIISVSYPNNKSKHLLGMAQMLVNEFNNEVPDNIDDLQKLPGVGRKTANVIVSVLFKKPAMAVDTHVFRVAGRVGLAVDSKTPLETEKQLVKGISEQDLSVAHHWLILHGRYVCTARNPKCSGCGIKDYCKYYSKINNYE
jgi:endonuclease-3